MKRLTILFIVLCLAFLRMVWADVDEYVAKYGVILDNCYQFHTTDKLLDQCTNRMSGPCIDIEGGGSDVRMRDCILAETMVWEKYLNLEYEKTMAALKEWPGEYDQALLEAQRAWTAFRHADCRLVDPIGHLGTYQRLLVAECYQTMTAERTLELRELHIILHESR
ncbi:MAG: lysozyme inhibitor LprI family protein [Gammaproteobacteria bacterium]|nr:lysozyme inhibitor LprI family protein [Gammaproteobacteria bacterium]MCY4219780.1 lysozyme inhibitor LprI family protein [Gammaproteobacteria bacterium]MCY4274244.1 lysozyme inhibitor LprI family protein [Gammaproteobacteria bacterium]